MVVGPKELSLSGQIVISATSLRIIKDYYFFLVQVCTKSTKYKKGKVRREASTAILSKGCAH